MWLESWAHVFAFIAFGSDVDFPNYGSLKCEEKREELKFVMTYDTLAVSVASGN